MRSTTWGSHRSGTVYFMLGNYQGRPAIKIGMTNQPIHQRAAQLGARVLAAHPGTGRNESELHARFHELALGHEWFRVDIELLRHVSSIGHVTEAARPNHVSTGIF